MITDNHRMGKLEDYLAQQAPANDGPRRLREVAYERIKDALQHAGLEPGEALSEVQLSKFLGISRTPIREALQQLAQEGMVQVIPGRAVTVASRSLKDVLDVVHVRSLLEPEVARLTAEAATSEQIERLRYAIQKMEEALRDDNYEGWTKADAIFHETMQQACPNQLLAETVVLLRNRVHVIANRYSQHMPGRLEACTAEKSRVVEAIANHDAKESEEAMREHIHKLRESMFNRLSYG